MNLKDLKVYFNKIYIQPSGPLRQVGGEVLNKSEKIQKKVWNLKNKFIILIKAKILSFYIKIIVLSFLIWKTIVVGTLSGTDNQCLHVLSHFSQSSTSLWPCGLYSTELLSMDSPGKNIGVGCHFLLWTFPTQGQTPCLLACPALPADFAHWATWESLKTDMDFSQRILLHLKDILFTVFMKDGAGNLKWMKIETSL